MLTRGNAVRPGRRDQRGSSAVELALVLPMLLMLLFGTITGGMAYFQKISMADAAREAARFGATADVTTTPDWASTVRTRAVTAATGVLDSAPPPDNPEVCVQFYDGGAPTLTDGECGNAPAPPADVVSGSNCVVRVYTRRPGHLDIGLKAWALTLEQDAYARYERAC